MKIAPEMHQQQFATLPITYVASQEIVVFSTHGEGYLYIRYSTVL